MIYEYECPNCARQTERFVHTFNKADDEFCECGQQLERQVSCTSNISVWNRNYIEEVDPNISFRSMRHVREVARAKGLITNPDPSKPFELEYRKKQEERDSKSPVSIDYGKVG